MPRTNEELEALGLTDNEIKYLLGKQITLLKQEVWYLILIEMRNTLLNGVQIVHQGQIMPVTRRPEPAHVLAFMKVISDTDEATITSVLRHQIKDHREEAIRSLANDPAALSAMTQEERSDE